MNRKNRSKLVLNKESVRHLTPNDLGQANGGDYTDAAGCVYTVPQSFCVCASKNPCSLGGGC
jgi:hypothetical protein